MHCGGIVETVWNCREEMIIISLKKAFGHYLKQSGTAEKTWKQCLHRLHYDGIWNDLELQRKK